MSSYGILFENLPIPTAITEFCQIEKAPSGVYVASCYQNGKRYISSGIKSQDGGYVFDQWQLAALEKNDE